MRRLHGVLSLTTRSLSHLKHQALIFDKFHALDIRRGPSFIPEELPSNLTADIDYLEQVGLLTIVQPPIAAGLPTFIRTTTLLNYAMASLGEDKILVSENPTIKSSLYDMASSDMIVRWKSATLNADAEIQAAPICQLRIPTASTTSEPATAGQHAILRIAFQSVPAPGESSSWQDILDFKTEMHDKEWAFRRFLHTLATKQQTEAEIRDDIEWTVNEYSKEMDRFKLKRSVSFMETYVIPTVEALENFKPSSFLKGMASIKKRKMARPGNLWVFGGLSAGIE